ncbi:hypothetical protein AB0L31_17570, partial [Streptomyces sp. NPDC052535]
MFPVVPERALLELARTEGGPDTLTLLVRDQDTRRLLLLRAVLDAAEAAGPSVCTAAQKAAWNPISSTAAAARDLFGTPVGGGDSWVEQHAL